MINYKCPQCKRALQSPESQIGTVSPCPQCQYQVQVPAVSTSSNTLTIVLIVVGVCGVALLGCIIFSLVAIQFLGEETNATFSEVGSAISGS